MGKGVISAQTLRPVPGYIFLLPNSPGFSPSPPRGGKKRPPLSGKRNSPLIPSPQRRLPGAPPVWGQPPGISQRGKVCLPPPRLIPGEEPISGENQGTGFPPTKRIGDLRDARTPPNPRGGKGLGKKSLRPKGIQFPNPASSNWVQTERNRPLGRPKWPPQQSRGISRGKPMTLPGFIPLGGERRGGIPPKFSSFPGIFVPNPRARLKGPGTKANWKPGVS